MAVRGGVGASFTCNVCEIECRGAEINRRQLESHSRRPLLEANNHGPSAECSGIASNRESAVIPDGVVDIVNPYSSYKFAWLLFRPVIAKLLFKARELQCQGRKSSDKVSWENPWGLVVADRGWMWFAPARYVDNKHCTQLRHWSTRKPVQTPPPFSEGQPGGKNVR